MDCLGFLVSLYVLLYALVPGCAGRTYRIAWLAPGNSSGWPVTSTSSVNALKLGLNSVAANPNIMTGNTIQ